MQKRLFILHTTPVTVQPLKDLAKELIPDCTVYNIVDDSILPQLIASDGDLSTVKERVITYVEIAAKQGADLILDACSSIGGLMPLAQERVEVPVVRIDEAMAETAVQRGSRIAVAATLGTTLKPTTDLLKEKAAELGQEVELVPYLAQEAYWSLVRGDNEAHDRILAETLRRAYEDSDVVVLAQASMARVVEDLSDLDQSRFLTSPRSGMMKVSQLLR
ncbi:MAG: hypothetical protein GX030_01440 [Firmicutes bacterium]|nr:hypothetical protein [Bacillota bacterium]